MADYTTTGTGQIIPTATAKATTPKTNWWDRIGAFADAFGKTVTSIGNAVTPAVNLYDQITGNYGNANLNYQTVPPNVGGQGIGVNYNAGNSGQQQNNQMLYVVVAVVGVLAFSMVMFFASRR